MEQQKHPVIFSLFLTIYILIRYNININQIEQSNTYTTNHHINIVSQTITSLYQLKTTSLYSIKLYSTIWYNNSHKIHTYIYI